jgi:protein-tyrosine-phosphatase
MEASVSPLPWPEFLKLLAHEIRWNILTLLARSDYRVQELVQQLKQPQNLISYHLRLLARQGLVNERRSSADGRDIYYSIDLEQVRTRYQAAAVALHLALELRVLFLCTENSARSQMAEGLLRHLAGASLDVASAGSQPAEVHPYAIRALAALGIDISHQRSKHLDVFREQSFDEIVTVCDRMRESCPTWPANRELIHWSFPDPAALSGISEAERYAAFEQLAQQLLTRLRHFLALLAYEQAQQTRTA